MPDVKRLRPIAWQELVALLFIAMTIVSVCFTCWPFSAYWKAKDHYYVVAINEEGITVTLIDPPRVLPPITLTIQGIGSTTTTTSAFSTGPIRHVATAPFWVLFLLTLSPAVPALLSNVLGAWRESRGGCRGCGYDLTGNRSGVCPECGTRIVGQVTP
jgi:hypothetical protein